MQFEFINHASLPRLAWCAQLRRGLDKVIVHHGPWVETRGDWFIEGAWAGPFAQGGMHQTHHMIGTAGRLEQDFVRFLAPTSAMDRLFSVRPDDSSLLISNSQVFLFVMSDDRPDPLYPFYYTDILLHNRLGLLPHDTFLPTDRHRKMKLHWHCDLLVDADLSHPGHAKIGPAAAARLSRIHRHAQRCLRWSDAERR